MIAEIEDSSKEKRKGNRESEGDILVPRVRVRLHPYSRSFLSSTDSRISTSRTKTQVVDHRRSQIGRLYGC